VPEGLKNRIEAAIHHVQARDLETNFGFWTVFHGMLGLGPETPLTDSNTREKSRAIDFICQGRSMPGLEFIPMGDKGVDVKTVAGSGFAQGHQDQFVAEMLQWGLPAQTRILINGQDYKFLDFLRYSKLRATVKENQELSWAIVIVATQFGTGHAWTNLKGDKLTCEDVVRYELGQPVEGAACGGTHRLFGLTWAYHLHLLKGGKTDGVWKDVADKIEQYKTKAKKTQNPNGALGANYFEGGKPANEAAGIAGTGHILEWLALAMTEEELRQPWVQEAANALVMMILNNRQAAIDGGSLYHAVHGLHMYYNRLFGPFGGQEPTIPLPPHANPKHQRANS
jgi:hypothetical protein